MKRIMFLIYHCWLSGVFSDRQWGCRHTCRQLELQQIWNRLGRSIRMGNNFSYRNGTVQLYGLIRMERWYGKRCFLSEPLSSAAEAGLLGFVLQSDFNESSLAYAYYTYDSNGKPVNRIVTLFRDEEEWHEQEILLDNIESGPVHHGGRLALSPEGTLFATIGDGATPENAQDPNSLNGKILKLQEDGTFTIVSMGHRNPQGLAWNDEGELYSSEHGQSANDEINKIVQGGNYGWPEIEGNESKEGMLSPLLTSGANETWAPSGMTFHNGLLYVAALRGEGTIGDRP